MPRAASTTGVRPSFSDPNEFDLEQKLEDLQDTRMRLEQQLPALVRVSSEEDLLSTDMSRAGSLEDVCGLPVTPSTYRKESRESNYGEDSDAFSLSGKL